MRQALLDKNASMYGDFVVRGREASRLEQLSDCIFALAITMLLISTSPPKTYLELIDFTSDMVSFGFCIAMIMWIWHGHYEFFLRFGLRNMPVIVLNTILMTVMLYFAYALRFLVSWLMKYTATVFKGFFVDERYFEELDQMVEIIGWSDLPGMLLVYDLTFVAVFLLFALLYKQALKNKDKLNLSKVETVRTEAIISHYMGVVAVASLSTVIALFGIFLDWAFAGFFGGIIYFLIGPVSYVIGKRSEKRLQEVKGMIVSASA